MSFTYPAFLFALAAIAIPIIIHLFNFRKFKTVYFSNVRFLKEVKQETQSRNRLKHLLVLICRILAILFLVLAFAQPFIPVEDAKVVKGDRAISVYIDNSFSMDALSPNGTLLEEAKKRAREIAAAYKPSDRFQLLSNDFEGKHQRLLNREDFLQAVEEIRTSPAGRRLSEVSSRSFDLLNQSGTKNKSLFVLSDFQKSITDLGSIKKDTGIAVRLVPLVSPVRSNVYIDTCWFETPVRQIGQVEKLHVRVRNSSDKDIENSSIRLFINNVQKTPASFSLEKGGQTEIILSFASRETGTQHCRIELNDHPVTFDDQFYFSFNVAANIPVLHISPEMKSSGFVERLFGQDSLFVLSRATDGKLDFSQIASSRLVILEGLKTISSGLVQELRKFMENGGSVLVFPSIDSELAGYRDLSAAAGSNAIEVIDTADVKVDRITTEHEIYKNVFDKESFKQNNLDLPKAFSHYRSSRNTRSTEQVLLRLQNGDAFLSSTQAGKGRFYLCTSPLDESSSNFGKHALFVPTLYQIAIYSQQVQPLFYTIGRDETILSSQNAGAENIFHIRSTTGGIDVIPEHRATGAGTEIFPHGQITKAGNYDLAEADKAVMGISFNYDRQESDLATSTVAELEAGIASAGLPDFSILESADNSFSASITELDQGKRLWKWCLLLALLFLAAEILLLRFLKS
jgi:hypothetical protein